MAHKKIGLVSGGFDPVHSGHIDMIQYVAGECDRLIVAINSDEWLIRKKGSYFMPWGERQLIMSSIKNVYDVIAFSDDDDSACDAIAKVKSMYPQCDIEFYNGGDRTKENILEVLRYCDDKRVHFHFGAGGDYKKNASSEILNRWLEQQLQTTQREWGVYNVLLEHQSTKLKTLTVNPKSSLSMQKHEFRAEHWYVVKGSGYVEMQSSPKSDIMKTELEPHNIITIPCGCWHKLYNPMDEELQIIEIQFGEKCEESDITRQD